ncbi:hypothetical protein HMPREF9278_1703 [Mobiluncus mulieris FB024-16]|nr:hypothetical protein HMPREF9278_1703 [Mobiluncus mulieris FB024-16]
MPMSSAITGFWRFIEGKQRSPFEFAALPETQESCPADR